jgi:hypothetical protein
MSTGLMQKIRGTTEALFRFVNGGAQIRSLIAGLSAPAVLEVRDPANAAFANMRGADPVTADDLATKRYVDSAAGGANGTKFIEVDMTGTSGPLKISTTPIPIGSHIVLCVVTPLVASPGTTFEIGSGTTSNLLMNTADSDLNDTTNASAIGTQDILWNAPTGVVVSVGGVVPTTPGVTYARVLVGYVEAPNT